MNLINNRQNLRKQVLNYHYELSGGHTLKLILRSEIAKKIGLGEEGYNNQELITAIQYLENKGFLKVQTNMQDSITDYGIDEVEDGFPSLFGVLVSSDETSPIVEKMEDLLGFMNDAINKCERGLLEAVPLSELLYKVELDMAEVAQNLEETWQLKCKKLTRQMRMEPKSGVFISNSNEASEKFKPWMELINEIAETLTGEKPRISESYLSTGTPYTARKILRQILLLAKSKLVVVDNFLHPETVILINDCLQNNPNLEIKFLTRDNSTNRNFVSFRSDYLLLQQQYTRAIIEAKTNNQCHDRFIIIADSDVYHSGHSFHDLGKKGSHVNNITDEPSKQNFLKDFNNWWNTGNNL